MATSIFDIKETVPNDELVLQALQSTKKLWDSLKDNFYHSYENVKEEWKYYSKKAGWSLLLKQKDKTIFYLIPCKETFKVSFVLGEKAVMRVMNSDINLMIKQLVENAVPYMEGRPFMIEVNDESFINDINELIKIKISN